MHMHSGDIMGGGYMDKAGPEKREFADWMLDEIERGFQPVRCDDLDAGEKMAIQAEGMKRHMPFLLMTAIRRPELVRKRKRLWDFAKDMLNLFEAGVYPKPNWWDDAHKFTQTESGG